MQIVLNQKSEQNGYPFFKLSSTMAWITYKDGNKRTRWAFETKTTISQMLAGHKQELLLDVYDGCRGLINMINRQANYIQFAQIRYKGVMNHRDDVIFEFKNGIWYKKTDKNMDGSYLIKIPFQVANKCVIINLNQQ
jgi:hypothetical protein